MKLATLLNIKGSLIGHVKPDELLQYLARHVARQRQCISTWSLIKLFASQPAQVVFTFMLAVDAWGMYSSEITKLLACHPVADDTSVACRSGSMLFAGSWVNICFGHHARTPKSLYPLSALYLLSDDFLDCKTRPAEKKLAYCDEADQIIKLAFEHGSGAVRAHTPLQISSQAKDLLIELAERIEPGHRKKIKEALVLLNQAQRDSLKQVSPRDANEASASALFGYSYAKGAYTFRLIALLISPNIEKQALDALCHFGGIYQLIDDLVDIDTDLNQGIMTFPQCYITRGISPLKKQPLRVQFFNEWTALPQQSTQRFADLTRILLNQIELSIAQVRKHSHRSSQAFSQIILAKITADIADLLKQKISNNKHFSAFESRPCM